MEKKLKFTNAFVTPVVIDWDYYVQFYTLPKTANQEKYLEQKTLIEKWIIQATDDINGLCNGRVYAEWDALDETSIIDQQRAAYLQKAIAKWVEFCICTGHIWANREDVVQGNIPISVRTESKNNEIELQRKDIIKLLKTGKWYTEVILGDVSCSYNTNCGYDLDEIINILNASYLRLDGNNWPYANLNFAGWGINNMGNIIAGQPTTVGANSVIDGFILRNCIFDVNADNIRVATYDKVGVVKVDANTMTVNADGLISAIIPEVTPATYDRLGSVIVDETTMTVQPNGLLSAKQIPIQTGPGLTYNNNILDVNHNLSQMDSITGNSDLLLKAGAGNLNLNSWGLINFITRQAKTSDIIFNGRPFNWSDFIYAQASTFAANVIENTSPSAGIFVLGSRNRVYSPNADNIVSIGYNNETSGSAHIIIGNNNDINPGNSRNIAIGHTAIIDNDSSRSIAIGSNAKIDINCNDSCILGSGTCSQPNTLQFQNDKLFKSGIIYKDRLAMTTIIQRYETYEFKPGVDNYFTQIDNEFLVQVIINFKNAGNYNYEVIMNSIVISANNIQITANQTSREPIIFQPGVVGSIKNTGSQSFFAQIAIIRSKVGVV